MAFYFHRLADPSHLFTVKISIAKTKHSLNSEDRHRWCWGDAALFCTVHRPDATALRPANITMHLGQRKVVLVPQQYLD